MVAKGGGMEVSKRHCCSADTRRHFVAVAACACGRLGCHRNHNRGWLLCLRLWQRLHQQQLLTTLLRRNPPLCLRDTAEADDDDGGRRRRSTAAIMESKSQPAASDNNRRIGSVLHALNGAIPGNFDLRNGHFSRGKCKF